MHIAAVAFPEYSASYYKPEEAANCRTHWLELKTDVEGASKKSLFWEEMKIFLTILAKKIVLLICRDNFFLEKTLTYRANRVAKESEMVHSLFKPS